MKLADALKRIESLGTAQNRKVFARHGVAGKLSGVSYANLEKLRKELRTDQALAERLWKSGNHDARVLATKIADAEACTKTLLTAWSKDLRNYVATDALSDLVARSAHGAALAKKWATAKGEWIPTLGWNVICRLAGDIGAITDAEASRLVKDIERRIHSAPNRTRYAMNGALIALGARSGKLLREATAAAKRIGKVEVDHGETGCQTPDAASAMVKVHAHAAKRRKKA